MDVWARIMAGEDAGDFDAPVLRELAGCHQSRGHHDEGDVLVHTRMVLTEVEARRGTAADARLLRLAAVLHDVGKPATSVRVAPGRYRSTGHEHVGAGIVRELCGTTGLKSLTLQERWALPLLVDSHMWYHHADDLKRNAVQDVSDHVSLDDLVLLWEADTRGRLCADPERLADQVAYGKMALEELGYGTRGPYEDLLTLSEWDTLPGHVRRHAHASLRHTIHPGEAHALLEREARTTLRGSLTYVVGLPGSGKSTWCRSNTPPGGVLVTSEGDRRRDRKLARVRALEQLETGLREGRDVVVDATHLRKEVRKVLTALADRYHARVHAVVVDTPLDVALRRQGTRPWREAVPQEALLRMCKMSDPLGRDEYDTLEVVTP